MKRRSKSWKAQRRRASRPPRPKRLVERVPVAASSVVAAGTIGAWWAVFTISIGTPSQPPRVTTTQLPVIALPADDLPVGESRGGQRVLYLDKPSAAATAIADYLTARSPDAPQPDLSPYSGRSPDSYTSGSNSAVIRWNDGLRLVPADDEAA